MSESTSTEAVQQRHVKQRTGTVVSAKASMTVTVSVDRRVRHPVYGKFVTRLKKYAAHDELGCSEGDRVLIEETKPLSKTKRWKVIEVVGKDR